MSPENRQLDLRSESFPQPLARDERGHPTRTNQPKTRLSLFLEVLPLLEWKMPLFWSHWLLPVKPRAAGMHGVSGRNGNSEGHRECLQSDPLFARRRSSARHLSRQNHAQQSGLLHLHLLGTQPLGHGKRRPGFPRLERRASESQKPGASNIEADAAGGEK